MAHLITLSDSQVYQAIDNGEFGPDVISSNIKTAIIMTQDWCHEWTSMKQWLTTLKDLENLDIYELIYNRASYFNDFLPLKEERWQNRLIPYIRYYDNGHFSGESNYVSRDDFLGHLGL